MKTRRLFKAGIGILAVFAIILIIISLTGRNDVGVPVYYGSGIMYENSLIMDVYTDKSRYLGGDNALASISLGNTLDMDIKADIVLLLKHLDAVVKKLELRNINLKAGDKREEVISLQLPNNDFTGYLLEVWLIKDKDILDFNSTAIDVSSDWTKFPRYGYLSRYSKQDRQRTADIIEELGKYHINGLQFYDWQYKHHMPLPEDGELEGQTWKEISNKTVYADTVRDYISEAHSRNMAAMNYNLIFGAWEGYEKDGVSGKWGLFKDISHTYQDFHPLPGSWASNKLYLMNPLNKNWQSYITEREKEVCEALDFDGWHMDQLGSRNAVFDYEGNKAELTEGYASLIRYVAEKLPEKELVFNAVGQYGQMQVANEPGLDFLYAEIWNDSSYRNLQMAIDEGNRLTDYKKATVLAAYMNYRKTSGEFNEHAVRLTDAVIFASGGGHIELGDLGMLSSEYFPNAKLIMGDSLKRAMRRYYDFLTAYQNFLRDGCRSISRIVESDDADLRSGIYPGTLWYIPKEKDGYEILHIINFSSNKSNNWRDDTGSKEMPEIKENLSIRYYPESEIEQVYFTSPDFMKSSIKELSFTQGKDDKGSYIEITVPRLEYWDMIMFKKK